MNSILIIDDDEDIRRSMSLILSEQKYQVDTAKDGHEGLSQYKSKPPDLVITDIIMPRVEGLELIQTLKSIQPKQKIIAISGGGSSLANYLHTAKIFGASTTLSKPFTRLELLDKVKSVLDAGEMDG